MKSKNNSQKINDINTVIDSSLINCIGHSNLYICKLSSIIDIYEKQIYLLQSNKPCFFQIKKVKEYNSQINNYKEKVINLYEKITEEFNQISEINKIIKN